jgi:hypothetical protein
MITSCSASYVAEAASILLEYYIIPYISSNGQL